MPPCSLSAHNPLDTLNLAPFLDTWTLRGVVVSNLRSAAPIRTVRGPCFHPRLCGFFPLYLLPVPTPRCDDGHISRRRVFCRFVSPTSRKQCGTTNAKLIFPFSPQLLDFIFPIPPAYAHMITTILLTIFRVPWPSIVPHPSSSYTFHTEGKRFFLLWGFMLCTCLLNILLYTRFT